MGYYADRSVVVNSVVTVATQCGPVGGFPVGVRFAHTQQIHPCPLGVSECFESHPLRMKRVGESREYQQATPWKQGMVRWVSQLAPWQVIAHLTFQWTVSLDSARRNYEKFMRDKFPGVSYFYALEQNPGRGGCHVHALWCDCQSKARQGIWQSWFDRFGRARIESVNDQTAVAAYCTKHLHNENTTWWNVKLHGHRHPALTSIKRT